MNEDEVDVPEIAVLPETDGDDIFSGRTDLPTYGTPIVPDIPDEQPPSDAE